MGKLQFVGTRYSASVIAKLYHLRQRTAYRPSLRKIAFIFPIILMLLILLAGNGLAQETPIPTISLPPTPTLEPTHVLYPDGVTIEEGVSLYAMPDPSAAILQGIPYMTSFRVLGRSGDDRYLKIELINGVGQGWIALNDQVVLFVPLDQVQVATLDQLGDTDLIAPQFVTDQTAGSGLAFAPYDYHTCGDTYWTGDSISFSMEALGYEGRYPRFTRDPIKLLVYYENQQVDEEWEIAIAETLAQLSQGVSIQRVFLNDFDTFSPPIPIDVLLRDQRVDLIWYILDTFTAPCNNTRSCSRYSFQGAVKGGSLRFVGEVFVPRDSMSQRAALLHGSLHALGLWVHSPHSEDMLHPNSAAVVLSERDIRTLRCLYNAPPYGDGVFPP